MRLLATVSILMAVTSSFAAADEPASSPRPATTQPAAGKEEAKPARPRKWLVHVNGSFNLYTYVGPTTPGGASAHLTPDVRFGVGEQIGVGYFVHPNISVRLTFQLSETLAGLPAGASPFQLFGVIPWVVYSTHGFYGGLGPMVDFVTYGKTNVDGGFYLSAGYVFSLGNSGLGLGPALNLITMFAQRSYVSLNQVVTMSYRF